VKVAVTVSDNKEQTKSGPLLLEGSYDPSGMIVHNPLVQAEMSGRVIVMIWNDAGFTESVLGQVTDVLKLYPQIR